MSYHCRVLSGLALLLVMLGLPVAPVLCELTCPQAGAQVAAPRQVVAAVHQAPPCHQSAAPEASGGPAGPVEARGLGAMSGHRCDHPVVLSPRRGPEGLRVPAPVAVARETSRHLSPFETPHAVAASLAAARGWSRPSGAACSLVLRI